MKLILTKQEFLQLRDIVVNIENPKVSDEFNRIITNQNPHINSATTTETLTLTVSAELSTEIGKVLITHSKGLGKNLNMNLTSLPKIISQAKKLIADLGTTIKGNSKK